jgi:hypothetical protein
MRLAILIAESNEVLLDDGEVVFIPEPSELFDLLDELLLAGRVSTR